MFPKVFITAFFISFLLISFGQENQSDFDNFEPSENFMQESLPQETEILTKEEAPVGDPINRCGDQVFMKDGSSFEGQFIKLNYISKVVFKKCKDPLGRKFVRDQSEVSHIVLAEGDTLNFKETKVVEEESKRKEVNDKVTKTVFGIIFAIFLLAAGLLGFIIWTVLNFLME
jgi:hypothetical protein